MDGNILPGEPETFSLFGKPLYRTHLQGDTLEKQKELYYQALNDWKKNPNNLKLIIWLGRRTAYLGRFREAASIYSVGIEKYPENPKLYRHRGHRFISLRLFDRAIEDFNKAAELMVKFPDEIEPDGIPNLRGIPLSTLYFNVWYHLGLSYYLIGSFEKALKSYQECLRVSDIDDKFVATAHWTYMTLRILNRVKEAEKLLERVKKNMDIIENSHYHSCLLMYKKEKSPEVLLKLAREEDDMGLITTGYGIANYYNYNGLLNKAVEVLKEIVTLPSWAGFGYIAAEADLKRMGIVP